MNNQNINESAENGFQPIFVTEEGSVDPHECCAKAIEKCFAYTFDNGVFQMLQDALPVATTYVYSAITSSLATEEEVVDVHKAQRIAPSTMRMLASNSRFLERGCDDFAL